MTSPALVLFQSDLRLGDHPALQTALRRGGPVIPVYLWHPKEETPWEPGGASRWWLHHSLTALENGLNETGSRLLVRSGPTLQHLQAIVKETGATAVYWNRRYEPACIRREASWTKALRALEVEVHTFHGNILFDPERLRTKSGDPFQVFTPFWRRCLEETVEAPLAAPSQIPAPKHWPASESIESLKLLPTLSWADGFSERWTPGYEGAQKRMRSFLKSHLACYSAGRDFPAEDHTSGLSPHLHFGELSPRQIWAAAGKETIGGRSDGAAEAFLREVGWREFAYHLLVHFPHTPEHALRKEFDQFKWEKNSKQLKAWQIGQTGYPIVDAGLRELWATGVMHNRVRMIVGSFLVKDLLMDWREGARWFWDTLVDADLAANTLNWQWVGGCGADAAPYFRIFNPILQGEKFDGEGAYIRRWVPEVATLPNTWLHKPWEAPQDVLAQAGIVLGKTYPAPLVDHGQARAEALIRYQALRR